MFSSCSPKMVKSFEELIGKFRYPSDIDNKIEAVVNSCKNTIEAQENKAMSLYNSKIYSIGKISNIVEDIYKNIENLKNLKLDGLGIIQNSETKLKDYNTIQMIVSAHKNFIKTKKFLKKLHDVEEEIHEEDIEKYHKIVYEKEEFLSELIWYKYDLKEEDMKLIESKITYLKKVSLEFTTFISKIIENFIEHCEIYDKINRIVEMEENRDIITFQAKDGQSSTEPVKKQHYLQNLKYTKREPKLLKNHLIRVIKASIDSLFVGIDKDQYLADMNSIVKDLSKLSQYELNFFPFKSFLEYYHWHFKKLIVKKLKDIEAEDILGIIEFKAMYVKEIGKYYEKDEENLSLTLIDDEQELLKRYSVMATNKLKSWIDNITDSEIERFRIREKLINKDENGKLISPGFINLMQIIKAQLEPVKFYQSIFSSIIIVLKEKCISFKDAIISSMRKELSQSIENKGLPGFEDYCIMFGNSGLKLTQYFANLEFFKDQDSKGLQSIFLEILQTSNGCLCDYVINTCKPVLSKVFENEWVDKNLSRVMTVTLQDFLQDYRSTLLEYSFITFICDLCTRLYESYKAQLKTSKIVMNKKISRYLANDYNKIVGVLNKFASEDEFIDYLKPILNFIPLIECSNGEVFVLEAKTLLQADSTIEKDMILNIVEHKTEISGEQKSIILQRIHGLFENSNTKKKRFLSGILNK